MQHIFLDHIILYYMAKFEHPSLFFVNVIQENVKLQKIAFFNFGAFF